MMFGIVQRLTLSKATDLFIGQTFQYQGHSIKSMGKDALTCHISQPYVVVSFQKANFNTS